MTQTIQAIAQHLKDNGITNHHSHNLITTFIPTKPNYHIHYKDLQHYTTITKYNNTITLITNIPHLPNSATIRKWYLANPQLLKELLLTLKTLP